MMQALESTIGPLGAVTADGPRHKGSQAPGQRVEPRFTLLIRAAKLIAGNDEFLVVLRDVRATV